MTRTSRILVGAILAAATIVGGVLVISATMHTTTGGDTTLRSSQPTPQASALAELKALLRQLVNEVPGSSGVITVDAVTGRVVVTTNLPGWAIARLEALAPDRTVFETGAISGQ